MQRETNYEKFPICRVSGCESETWEGWPRILERLRAFAGSESRTISFECYPGVFEKVLICALEEGLRPSCLMATSDLLKSPSEIELLVSGVLGDDPVFGRMNSFEIADFFDTGRLAEAREQVKNWKQGLLVMSARARRCSRQSRICSCMRTWLGGRSSSVNDRMRLEI
jgi:hypothetical protein